MLTTIFYHVDDFCKKIKEHLLPNDEKVKVGRPSNMPLSDILTIIIFFQHSKIKTFKDYYIVYIQGIHKTAFKKVLSYNRFNELMNENMQHVALFALSTMAEATGVQYIDSTTLPVCHNKRIGSHKVAKGFAQRGKSSMGWFFGFKLHFVINHYGEIVNFTITPGNVDDRDSDVINHVTKDLFGKLFGDRGYLSKELFTDLFEKGIQLITRLKRNMVNKLMPMMDKLLLGKRGLIESCGNILKNVLTIQHTRHRSVAGFLCNIFSGVSAYAFYESKPSLAKIEKALSFS
jgi:hypothetical protein